MHMDVGISVFMNHQIAEHLHHMDSLHEKTGTCRSALHDVLFTFVSSAEVIYAGQVHCRSVACSQQAQT